MNIRVTLPGTLFVIPLIIQLFLVLSFVFLGLWGEVEEHSTPIITLLGGWWLREWHNDVLRKKSSTKGTT